MKHKDKVKLARKHMGRLDHKHKVSPFQTEWWEERKTAIQERVKKREKKQKELAEKREEKK